MAGTDILLSFKIIPKVQPHHLHLIDWEAEA